MVDIALSAALLVAASFAAAGVLKLWSWGAFVKELRDYKILPRWALRPVAVVLPLLEIAAAGATVAPVTRRLGAALLLGLLLVFTGVLVRALLRGETSIRCACFGALSQELSWSMPARNLAMAAAVAAGIAAAGTRAVPWPGVAGWVGAGMAAVGVWVAVEYVRTLDTARRRASA